MKTALGILGLLLAAQASAANATYTHCEAPGFTVDVHWGEYLGGGEFFSHQSQQKALVAVNGEGEEVIFVHYSSSTRCGSKENSRVSLKNGMALGFSSLENGSCGGGFKDAWLSLGNNTQVALACEKKEE